MDNASKALLIAGGILIGTLIISLSMYLLASFRDAYSKSMQIHSSIEINAFNSNFTNYGYTSGDGITYITGADAYNILSYMYDINNDEYSLPGVMVLGGSVFSLNRDDSNFYEKMFYYSEMYSKRYRYRYEYDSNGIVNRITIS